MENPVSAFQLKKKLLSSIAIFGFSWLECGDLISKSGSALSGKNQSRKNNVTNKNKFPLNYTSDSFKTMSFFYQLFNLLSVFRCMKDIRQIKRQISCLDCLFLLENKHYNML